VTTTGNSKYRSGAIRRRASHTDRNALHIVITAAGISSLGDGVRRIAMPLTAASLTSDPLSIGLVTVCAQLPWLMAPILGPTLDRFRPLRLMYVVDSIRAVIIGLFAAALATSVSGVALLAGAALLMGLAEVLAESAAQIAMPMLVAEGDLEFSNSRLMGAQTVTTQFVGPPLGAWLGTIGIGLPYGLDAVTFIASALLIFGLRHRNLTETSPTEDVKLSSQMLAGFRWARWHPVIRVLIMVVIGLGFFDGMVGAILVVFAYRQLHISAFDYGLLLAIAAVGSLVGTFGSRRLAQRARRKPMLLVSTLGAGVSYLVLAGTSSPSVAAVMLAVNSGLTMAWNVLTVSARQRLIPVEILGRVTTVYRMAAWGALAVGGIFGGALAKWVGPRDVVTISGVGLALMTFAVMRIPSKGLEPTEG